MGLFGALGKIIAGKPVYTPENVQQNQYNGPPPDVVADHQLGAPISAGPKTIPRVRFGRVVCHANGPRFEVYADVRNQSGEELFIDKIMLLGTKREVDSRLRPGESRQFLVYSGPPLTAQPGGYAEVQYRKQADGDYFADYHQVRCRQLPDGTYTITEMLLQGPVRDIQ